MSRPSKPEPMQPGGRAPSPPPKPLVLAITGASGAIYAVRLLQVLATAPRPVHLTISPSGAAVFEQELGLTLDLDRFSPAGLLDYRPAWSPAEETLSMGSDASDRSWLHYHRYDDYLAPIASGSFLTAGMVVLPCSGATLSSIAHASASNLIQRAAEVHLKEHRKLVLVPRETPLSVLQLENLHRVAAAGAIVLPAMPGWYHGVRSLDDLVDFVVARVLDQLEIEHHLMQRWGEEDRR